MEKIKIGTIETIIGVMSLYYNGEDEEMTAELDDFVEEIGMKAGSVEEAREIAWSMYNSPYWGLTLAV